MATISTVDLAANKERATRAEQSIGFYRILAQGDPEDMRANAVDLLADMHHLLGADEMQSIIDSALLHYRAES